MGLQEKLDAQVRELQSAAPKEALDVMHQATVDLQQSGIMDHVTSVGDAAPDFSLKNYQGKTIALSDKLSEGPVVLGFYRGGW